MKYATVPMAPDSTKPSAMTNPSEEAVAPDVMPAHPMRVVVSPEAL